MNEPQASTITGIATGTAGLTFPLWNDAVAWFAGVNQVLVALLGLLVLSLTALKLWTEYRVARQNLRDREGKGR